MRGFHPYGTVSSVLQDPTAISPKTDSGQDIQAGYTSLLAEGSATGETYFQVLDENQTLGYSPTTEAVNEMLHAEEQERMVNMLPDILLDENLDENFKRLATRTALDSERPEADMSYQYGRDQLEEVEPAEYNEEYRDVKEDLFASLDTINRYRQAQEAVLDQSNLTQDQGLAATAADFVTLMIPFYEQSIVAEVASGVNEGDAGAIAEAFILMGESKQSFRDALEAMPVEQRIQALQSFANIIDQANSNVFMTNRMSGGHMLETLVYGGYEDWERWLDNAVSILDLSIIGKPVGWFANTIKGGKAGVKANAVRNTTRPTSPHRMAAETNPTTTRSQVADIIADDTGETARALTGADRTEAVMDTVMPEVGIAGQGLRNKAGNSLGNFEMRQLNNPELQEMLDTSVIGALTKKEMEAATARVVNKLQNAKGVTSRKEMFQVEQVDAGARIKGMYGPTEGGWDNAQEALDLVEISLRGEGVPKDSLQLFKRGTNGEYTKIDNVPTEKGDYLVGIDYDYEVRFSDVTGNWEKFGTSWNFLNRVPLFAKGNLNRNFFDPASVLDPHIALGANAAVDKGARVTKLMLKEAKNFSDKFRAAPDGSQQLMLDYIKEANEQGLKFNKATLRNEWGFGDAEIEALQSFRTYWDDVWIMRNRTDVKSMRNDGFLVMEDAATDTRLYGQPRQKGNVDRTKRVFDPETEDFRTLSESELTDLYNTGGGVMQMRRPLDYDGVVTDYVMYKREDSVRGLTNDDIVYPYRDGYYQVQYTSPHFIVKEMTDGTRTYTKAVATAESVEDANLYIQRLAKTDPEGSYNYRGNVKDPTERAGFEQDVFETYGGVNQRARGKQLENATAVVNNTEQTNIKGPVDSMIDTARSMGSRVSMSDYMNAAKQRFIETYSDTLTRGPDGVKRFPAQMEDIGKGGQASARDVADARATFEYIAYLEHGYINSVDESIKGMLRSASEAVGERGFGTAERALRALSSVGPTEISKTAAFQSYIALNPIRQGLLNAHQSALLLANFPKYMVNPKGVVGDMSAFVDLSLGGHNTAKLAKLTNRSESELRLMFKEFNKSGLADSIDYQNMVRGSLLDLAESKRISGSKVGRAVSGALNAPRRVGFDAGEWVNLTSSWLAHYDRAKTAAGGKALTASDFHRIGAEARNYTMNMNRAGDMPYNQNAAAMIFQFFQVPHKSLLQMTNRSLSGAERARLGGYNALMYGLPATAMYTYFGDILPDREEYPELHDATVQGLEFYLMNKAIQGLTGLDSNIDFGNLAPSDAYGIYETLHSIYTTEVGEVLANSPAGSLFFGDNARMYNFAKSASKFFNPFDTNEDDPVTASQVFTDLAHLSSGMSNFFKAQMAWEYEKAFNARGAITDASVSKPEAVAKAFGFRTMDEVRQQVLNNKIYETKAQAVEDANKWYKEYTGRLARDGVTAQEIEYHTKVLSQGMRVFENSDVARNRINDLLVRDIQRGRGTIYDAAIKLAGEKTPEELEAMFRNAPDYDPVKKQQLLDTIENIKKWKSE